jgi:hypothetical protein
MEFVVGEHYSPLLAQGNTRKVGRWRETILSTSAGRQDNCQLFKSERNPEAPHQIQVGKGPRNVRKAELLREQGDSRIPVFIKREYLVRTGKPW